MKRPEWLDVHEYPFMDHYFSTPAGSMHYVDEVAGDPILFVHGNPSWSFEFRRFIKILSRTNRCIAPDHIGFGLSEKPSGWSYLPRQHAENLGVFLESLDLHDITMVVGDWGGPIGLSYALEHPERVRNIVITNTWLWPVNRDWYYQLFSRSIGGPVGRYLIRKYNLFTRVLVPRLYRKRERLTPNLHRHFVMPFSTPGERKGPAVFPQQITGSSAWLHSLWNKRNNLNNKKIVIVWGMKDMGFRQKELNQWVSAFPHARVMRLSDAGHFVADERPDDLLDAIMIIL